jgi:hypothetical protein
LYAQLLLVVGISDPVRAQAGLAAVFRPRAALPPLLRAISVILSLLPEIYPNRQILYIASGRNTAMG